MTLKKRFIAGAVCPVCNEVDRLMMWVEDGLSNRECRACGYRDKLDEQGRSIPCDPVATEEVLPLRIIPAPPAGQE